jgi:hypothetical protein
MGRPSFKTSDVVKNEVRDVIDGDRRLTVREVADKGVILKTTVHDILVQELHMNSICARWVPRMLSEENMTDCLMNLCVSVGVFPMSTQNFITALCSTLFENVVFSGEEGFIFKV